MYSSVFLLPLIIYITSADTTINTNTTDITNKILQLSVEYDDLLHQKDLIRKKHQEGAHSKLPLSTVTYIISCLDPRKLEYELYMNCTKQIKDLYDDQEDSRTVQKNFDNLVLNLKHELYNSDDYRCLEEINNYKQIEINPALNTTCITSRFDVEKKKFEQNTYYEFLNAYCIKGMKEEIDELATLLQEIIAMFDTDLKNEIKRNEDLIFAELKKSGCME